MPVSAENVNNLHKFEIKILKTIEYLHRRYQWIPYDDIKSSTGFSDGELNFRIGHLLEMDMLRFHKAPYDAYSLSYTGYDSLALIALKKNGTVHSLGQMFAVGKESEVYEAIGIGMLVIKFHHVGQRSFQSVRRNRAYLPYEKHCPWVYASHLSARQEYEVITRLKDQVKVPLPVGLNRNALVESMVMGANLNQVRLEDPEPVLEMILDEVKKAYELDVIHADLSEYNIMINEEGEITLIDWPQWIPADHPNADEILKRDLDNVINYFRRKYGVQREVAEVLYRVIG